MSTIAISDSLRRKLKQIVYQKDITYEEFIDKYLLNLYNCSDFKSEKDVCEWFTKNYKLFGYKSIRRISSKGDYIGTKDDGTADKIEVEFTAKNFGDYHLRDSIDIVICAYGNEQDIRNKGFKGEIIILQPYNTGKELLLISVTKEVIDYIYSFAGTLQDSGNCSVRVDRISAMSIIIEYAENNKELWKQKTLDYALKYHRKKGSDKSNSLLIIYDNVSKLLRETHFKQNQLSTLHLSDLVAGAVYLAKEHKLESCENVFLISGRIASILSKESSDLLKDLAKVTSESEMTIFQEAVIELSKKHKQELEKLQISKKQDLIQYLELDKLHNELFTQSYKNNLNDALKTIASQSKYYEILNKIERLQEEIDELKNEVIKSQS